MPWVFVLKSARDQAFSRLGSNPYLIRVLLCRKIGVDVVVCDRIGHASTSPSAHRCAILMSVAWARTFVVEKSPLKQAIIGSVVIILPPFGWIVIPIPDMLY